MKSSIQGKEEHSNERWDELPQEVVSSLSQRCWVHVLTLLRRMLHRGRLCEMGAWTGGLWGPF